MSYEQKYIKYKTKYIELKNLKYHLKNLVLKNEYHKDYKRDITINKLEKYKEAFGEKLIKNFNNQVNNDVYRKNILEYFRMNICEKLQL